MANINFDNITGNEAASFEETTSQTGKQMPEFDMPDKNVSPVDQRSGMTLEEISDPSKIKVSIADYDTPFVVLFGPPSCGKTMTLVRLARYLRKQTYTVEIVRSFRPAYDNKYKELCDNFDKLIESDEAAKSTADINFMLVKVFYRSKPICQILEAPGEAYFMPSEPNKDFPRYVNAIINHNNRRIWIVLVEPDSTNANMDDEARLPPTTEKRDTDCFPSAVPLFCLCIPLMKRSALIQRQRRGAVRPCLVFAVQFVESLRVMAEQFKAGEHIGRILLFFALFLDKPVQKFHRAEILFLIRGLIDRVDEPGHIALMRLSFLQRIDQRFQCFIRFGDRFQRDRHIIVLQILHHQQGMIHLFLRLDLIPVRKAVQRLVLVEVCEIQIEIGRVKFFVDLCVQQISNFFA